MTPDLYLWRSEGGARWFLLPVGAVPDEGGLELRATHGGGIMHVAEDWARGYEVDEDEGRRHARDELNQALGELRSGIGDKLAGLRQRVDAVRHASATDDSPVTPDAVPAVWALVKSLPGVIGGSLSGDAARIARAGGTMADLQRRLIAAGIDVDARFADFPDRLAELRADFTDRRPD